MNGSGSNAATGASERRGQPELGGGGSAARGPHRTPRPAARLLGPHRRPAHHVVPRLGHRPVADIALADVRGLVDRFGAAELAPSTVTGAVGEQRFASGSHLYLSHPGERTVYHPGYTARSSWTPT